MDEEEDLRIKFGLPARATSPSLLQQVNPGDEVAQPPPSFVRTVVKDPEVEIVDLVDSDTEMDNQNNNNNDNDDANDRATPPIQPNLETKFFIKTEDESDDDIEFIGYDTNENHVPNPPEDIIRPKQEPITIEDDIEEDVSINNTDIHQGFSSTSIAPQVSTAPQVCNGTTDTANGRSCNDSSLARNEDTDWDCDPDWENQPSASKGRRLLPTTATINTTPSPLLMSNTHSTSTPASIPSLASASSKTTSVTPRSHSHPRSTQTAEKTQLNKSNPVPAENIETSSTGGGPSESNVAHEFLVPDLPGSRPEKTIQEVRLVHKDGTVKRFIEVDGKRTDEGTSEGIRRLVSDACQTGESIVNGEPSTRVPIDLNLPPPPTRSGSGVKRPHEDYQTRNVRSCGTSSGSRTFQVDFKTPEDLIALISYCGECKKRFSNRRESVDHHKKQHKKKFCPCCYHLFSISGTEAKQHFLDHHVCSDKNMNGEEVSPCIFCASENPRMGRDCYFTYEGMYQHICKRHLVPLESQRQDSLHDLQDSLLSNSAAFREGPIVYISPEPENHLPVSPVEVINSRGANVHLPSSSSKINPSPSSSNTRPPGTWRTMDLQNKAQQASPSASSQQPKSSSKVDTRSHAPAPVSRSKSSNSNSPLRGQAHPSASSQQPKSSSKVDTRTRSHAPAPVSRSKSSNSNSPIRGQASPSASSQQPKSSSKVDTRSKTTSDSASQSKGTNAASETRLKARPSSPTSSGRTSTSKSQQHPAGKGKDNELTREVKDALKYWWKENKVFPSVPSFYEIRQLANRHDVLFELVKAWFERHNKKREQKSTRE